MAADNDDGSRRAAVFCYNFKGCVQREVLSIQCFGGRQAIEDRASRLSKEICCTYRSKPKVYQEKGGEKMKERFYQICRENIKRDGIEELLEWCEKSDFFKAPASTKYHGAYESGLLEHSLNVYACLVSLRDKQNQRRKEALADAPSISDESVAICGLFHDICKANYYVKDTRNVKDKKTGAWQTVEIWAVDDKTMLGHGEGSCIILQQFMKLSHAELLAIRWHMNGYDAASRGGDRSSSSAFDEHVLAPMLALADMEATYLMEGITQK